MAVKSLNAGTHGQGSLREEIWLGPWGGYGSPALSFVASIFCQPQQNLPFCGGSVVSPAVILSDRSQVVARHSVDETGYNQISSDRAQVSQYDLLVHPTSTIETHASILVALSCFRAAGLNPR